MSRRNLSLDVRNVSPVEPNGVFADSREGYLGVDVGSVSTDLVVLDAEGTLLSAVYLPTRGRPVDALSDGLEILRARFAGGLHVLGCTTTGSGRYIAGRLLGADVIKNEIICQLLGARHYIHDVDTVMEIGGQDSKFVSVCGGRIADFAMNKICAAGTGSFLEEQAQEMGIDIIGGFSKRAFASMLPRDLGASCTVFMETQVVGATLAGVPLDDICAGLAYSIVRNYLEKVVGRRPIGQRIVFQGGTASNDAVVAALAQTLDRPVTVHPFNRLSGAIGAALAARNAVGAGRKSTFKGFDSGLHPLLRTFECKRCSNRCEVSAIDTPEGPAFFGDTCERYTNKGIAGKCKNRLPNLAMEYMAACEAGFRDSSGDGRRIGIPRASTLMRFLPFWATFFRRIGFTPVLSTASSAETLTLGMRHLSVGVCLPIKLAAGHVNSLLQQEADLVFLPAIVRLPGNGPTEEYTCPYAMAVLGKPYTVFDAHMNLNLFERLRKLDVLALPMPYLAPGPDAVKTTLPWRLSADIYRAAVAVRAIEGMYPLIISNFGCGPDAFVLRQVEAALRDKPCLVLEFDEHRGEAGVITRIEAFVDQVDAAVSSPALARTRLPAARSVTTIPDVNSEIRIPYFADHVYAFSGLWRFKGYQTEVLPMPDQKVRLLGEQYAMGKECHAYPMILGDLIRLHREEHERRLVYYFPGTVIPCLLQQYGDSMRSIIEELGIENIDLCSPSGTKLLSVFGMEAAERFYLGLMAVELLVKAACQVRPYELEKGQCAALHRRNLLRLEAAVAGGNVLDALDESLRQLADIPVDRSRPRRLIGIAGDVYTKVNQTANNDLYTWLEARGLEVWPSPFQVDLVDFGISREFLHSLCNLGLPDLLIHASVAVRRAVHSWRVRHVVGSRIRRLQEPGYRESRRLASPYMPNENSELLFVNIARIVDFARHGADGIINAVCLNCMVGNASAAIIEKIRRDYDNVPIITAVYSGGETASQLMALDAFAGQVEARHSR